MSRTRILYFVGISALAIAATQQARADVFAVTYTGTVSGTDTDGLFGAAGSTLTSAAFTSTYTYDPSQFGSVGQSSSSTQHAISGGTIYWSNAGPFLSANLIVNGINHSQITHGHAEQLLQTGSSAEVYSYAQDTIGGSLLNEGNVTGPVNLSFSASQSFVFSSPLQGFLQYGGNEYLSLVDTQVSITDIPEPASLALLAGAVAMFAMSLGARRMVFHPMN